ncbi:hypothetical protein B0H21DRAFT_828622 [Amylocystis lapponica]|nr:hypothetical protein B0H21DRAFT_828622 [Amylocystis lapponica]
MSRDQSHEQILEEDSPLALVPMTDDEAAHWRIHDAEIRAQLADNSHAKHIIMEVVEHCSLLDRAYMRPRKVSELLKRHKGLSQAVERYWQEGDLTAIRRLSILRPPTVEGVLKKYPFELVKANADDDATRAQDADLLNLIQGTPYAHFIISEVVRRCSRLDSIYLQPDEVDKLLQYNKGLSELVETCWNTGSLSTIRRLELLQDWWQ